MTFYFRTIDAPLSEISQVRCNLFIAMVSFELLLLLLLLLIYDGGGWKGDDDGRSDDYVALTQLLMTTARNLFQFSCFLFPKPLDIMAVCEMTSANYLIHSLHSLNNV